LIEYVERLMNAILALPSEE